MPSRSIDTGIWGEDGFARAGAIAKILFVRLVSGDDTGSAGALKTRPKRLAADLEGDHDDVTVAQVEEAIEQLKAAGLIRTYADGWIWMPKFIHWQAHSEGFLKAADRQAAECPDSLARAIRRAVEKKRDLLDLRSDKSRTKKVASSSKKSEGTPKPPPKAPRAIASARGKGSGSKTQTLTPPDPPQRRRRTGPAASPDPSPGAQAQPPVGRNGNGGDRRHHDDIEPALDTLSPTARAFVERGRAAAARKQAAG